MKAQLLITLKLEIDIPEGQNTLSYDVGSIFEPLEGHPDIGKLEFVISQFDEII